MGDYFLLQLQEQGGAKEENNLISLLCDSKTPVLV